MNKLITNLNLNPNGSYGQSIYNSQLYGTFFGVYAYIKSTEITEKPEERKINSMTLQVVNYKGELDLGIEKAEFKPNESGGGTLYITVRTVVSNVIHNLSGTAKEVKTDQIEVEGINGEICQRGSFINVVRYLKPIHADKSDSSSALNEGVCDNEFHYREGTVVPKYTLKQKDVIGGRPTEPQGEFVPNCDVGVMQSGHFCPWAELILFWIG